jgi:hypothetical protein
MDDRKSIEVEITEEMIDAGIGEFLDFRLGGMTSEDMVKNVFASMISVSRLGNAPEFKGHVLHQIEPLDSRHLSADSQGFPDEPNV